MLHLIPKVKSLEIQEGYLLNKAIFCDTMGLDARLVTALGALSAEKGGTPLKFSVGEDAQDESYTLSVTEQKIRIEAPGVRGAFYTNGQEEIVVPSIKVKALETTGAGDAFNGGLSTAIAEGLPMQTALQFATCTAAISVTRLGSSPSMPYRHEILALLEKEFGTRL